MADERAIALAQLNYTVGDVEGNAALLSGAAGEAGRRGASLVVASELCLIGYPPEDLVLRPSLVASAEHAARRLAAEFADGPAIIVGAPWREDGCLYNAALLLSGGRLLARRRKHRLPNYGVFDERRLFSSATLEPPLDVAGLRLGLLICEDMWDHRASAFLAEHGAQLLLSINGSPYERGKRSQRLAQARARAGEVGLPLLYVNQYGGQDELVFDGGSFVMASDAFRQGAYWRRWLGISLWRPHDGGWRLGGGDGDDAPQEDDDQASDRASQRDYQALTTAIADYVAKTGFNDVLLGLSGGVDSALCAALATDALGAKRVRGVAMPSRYNSAASVEDAARLSRRLGVRFDVLPLEPLRLATRQALTAISERDWDGVTGQNVQARLRGLLLMALSNASGALLLSAGNKSESAVGYSTLYGDMCGGFNPLKDLYKTDVYRLALWRNRQRAPGALGPPGEVIPAAIIAKAPSAELSHGQKDEDDLPPYPALDAILRCLVEGNLSVTQTVARGHQRPLVEKIWRMLLTAEYKRRQGAPGVKLGACLFGRDRRYPIVHRDAEARRPNESDPVKAKPYKRRRKGKAFKRP